MAQPKRHPGRKRRITGWLLLSLAVLVAGVWAASRTWCARVCVGRDHRLDVGSGRLSWLSWRGVYDMLGAAEVTRIEDDPWARWWAMPLSNVTGPQVYHKWIVTRYAYSPAHVITEVHFWPLPFILAAAAVPPLWSGIRTGRRLRAGLCAACGYDKRGIPAGSVCPECGK